MRFPCQCAEVFGLQELLPSCDMLKLPVVYACIGTAAVSAFSGWAMCAPGQGFSLVPSTTPPGAIY